MHTFRSESGRQGEIRFRNPEKIRQHLRNPFLTNPHKMIHKERIGNELYVYCNGKLLYKRWIDKGYGIVFDKFGLPFTAKDVNALNNPSKDKEDDKLGSL